MVCSAWLKVGYEAQACELAAMKAKVSELKQMWRVHLSRGASASNTPSPKTLFTSLTGSDTSR